MIVTLIAALLSSSKSEIPPDLWRCDNQIEVWCTVDSCAAKPADEMTPLSVSASLDGRFSICAYTGCWEGKSEAAGTPSRLLWAADAVPFSTNDAFTADISLLIIAKDGVGFVRVGGIATPLLCAKAEPGGF